VKTAAVCRKFLSSFYLAIFLVCILVWLGLLLLDTVRLIFLKNYNYFWLTVDWVLTKNKKMKDVGESLIILPYFVGKLRKFRIVNLVLSDLNCLIFCMFFFVFVKVFLENYNEK